MAETNPWLPDDAGEQLGALTEDGTYVPLTQGSAANRNRLQHHSDPAVRRLGDWLAAAPPDMPTGMATMGGILIGLRFSQLYDKDVIDDLLAKLVEPKGGDMEPLDDVIYSIMDGLD